MAYPFLRLCATERRNGYAGRIRLYISPAETGTPSVRAHTHSRVRNPGIPPLAVSSAYAYPGHPCSTRGQSGIAGPAQKWVRFAASESVECLSAGVPRRACAAICFQVARRNGYAPATRQHRKHTASQRRNGYAFRYWARTGKRRCDCGQVCGNSRLSPQNLVQPGRRIGFASAQIRVRSNAESGTDHCRNGYAKQQ